MQILIYLKTIKLQLIYQLTDHIVSYQNTVSVPNQKVPNQAIRFICIEDTSNLVLYWKEAVIISYFLACSFLFIIYC